MPVISSSTFWESTEYLGEVIVILACVGEFFAEFVKIPKDKEQRERFTRTCVLVLIGGLAIGLLGLFKTTQLSKVEIATLNKQVAAAGSTNLWLSVELEAQKSNNLVLQSKVTSDELARVELEKLLLPISFDDPSGSASRLSVFSGTKAEVRYKREDSGSGSMMSAVAITKVLKDAKWQVRETWTTNAEFTDLAAVSINVPPGPLDIPMLNNSLEACRALEKELITNRVITSFERQQPYNSNLAPYQIIVRAPINEGPGPLRMRREYFFKNLKTMFPPETNTPDSLRYWLPPQP